MGLPKTLNLYPKDSEGVDVTYVRSRRVIWMSGWFHTYAGIAPREITLGAFLEALGITKADCRRALAEHGRIE